MDRPFLKNEDIIKILGSPKDLSKHNNEKKASILALHFIGFLVKPIGISDELYQECLIAFNNHRGKVEWEIEAILKVLENEN